MVALPAEFRATLESYAGPLDLLLYLIKKEEIDVFDIPISRVIEQYQVYLAVLREVDPNACGEFLVMAAQLMEIKSKLLLPREVLEADEETEDPRLELVRQLLEYKKYKERALLLERRLDLHRRRYGRPPLQLPLADDALPPLDLGELSVWDLLTAFHRIQLALGQRGPIQVVATDRPIEDYIADVVAKLEAAGGRPLVFDELFSEVRRLEDAIGYFLAVLELAKERRIRLSQEGILGPILIALRSAVEESPEVEPAAGQEAGEDAGVPAPPIDREEDEAAQAEDDPDLPEIPEVPDFELDGDDVGAGGVTEDAEDPGEDAEVER
jgi:segregation and condensation protein A